MIGIQLQGQLGNQLFQIAFIRNVSKILNESYVIIDDKSYGCLAEKYFVLKFYEKRYFRKIMRKIFFLFPRKTIEFNNWQEPEEVLKSLKPGVNYMGFFQSEKFQDNNIRINPFRIKKSYKTAFFQKYGDLFSHFKIVIIHIRLKDYFDAGSEALGGKGQNLPMTYYQKAIDQLVIDDKTKVMVISDDIEYVKQNFKPDVNFSIETNEPVIDFLLMLNADSLIISNSSFSWWGAFLNNKSGLKVIAPEFWLGFKVRKTYPAGIICNTWSTIQV